MDHIYSYLGFIPYNHRKVRYLIRQLKYYHIGRPIKVMLYIKLI